MHNKIIKIIFLQILIFFILSNTVYAWDNPNKPEINTGVYALKTAMIGSYMDGFNDGKRNLPKDEDYTCGINKDFLKYYEDGYYKGRVFWYNKK